MAVRQIYTHPRFDKSYRQLPKLKKEKAKAQEQLFRADPFDSRLKTHKLHGRDEEAWAFSINRRYRVKFVFLGDDSVLFLDIGTHAIYR